VIGKFEIVSFEFAASYTNYYAVNENTEPASTFQTTGDLGPQVEASVLHTRLILSVKVCMSNKSRVTPTGSSTKTIKLVRDPDAAVVAKISELGLT
jgi:hypothetical protein